jgi:Na+-driven multidrug efflux pump
MHQAQISENKIKFFEHYLLKQMNIGLICCLAFMITIFGLRVNLSSTFLTNYTNVLNADSSVSDLMQLC